MTLARTGQRLRQVTLPVQQLVWASRYVAAVQTAVAAAKATFALALLSVADPIVPVVVALIAFGVYNGNNLTDADEDAINRPGKARFVARHRTGITLLAVATPVGAVVLAAVHGGALAGAIAAVPVVCAVLYSVSALPGRSTRRLKDCFLINTTLVAGAWAVPVAFLPVAVAEGVALEAAVVVFAYFFLRTLVSVEVFNARDVAGDRAAGVTTIPVALGLAGTSHVLLGAELFSLALVLWAIEGVGLPLWPVLAVLAVTSYSVVLTARLPSVTDWQTLCFAKDMEYIVLGAVALLAL